MRFRRVVIILTLGIIVVALASIDAAWATPMQPEYRMTVPSMTPSPPPPPPPSKEKDTPTPAPPTMTTTPTRVSGTPLASVTPGPVLTQTLSATMTATESPKATDTIVPPTQTVAPLLATSTPVAAATSLPAPTVVVTAAASTAPAGSNWLLWGIGLILIVGGAVLVFVRPGKKSA